MTFARDFHVMLRPHYFVMFGLMGLGTARLRHMSSPRKVPIRISTRDFHVMLHPHSLVVFGLMGLGTARLRHMSS